MRKARSAFYGAVALALSTGTASAQSISGSDEFIWVAVAGASGCQIVGSSRLNGPIVTTSDEGHRYIFGSGQCADTVDMGGEVKIYAINGAYPELVGMIKVIETDGTQWWIRREQGRYSVDKR